jgi:hypothetical protein
MASAVDFEDFAEECIRAGERTTIRDHRNKMWRMAAACLLIAQVLAECENEQALNSELAEMPGPPH